MPVRPLNVGILPNLLGYAVRRAHMALFTRQELTSFFEFLRRIQI